jgi:outer membrane lipoprotein-sorting protein
MRLMRNKFLWIAALSGFLIATGAQAQAPEVLNPPVKTTAKKKNKKAKTATGSNAKFLPGSQETNQQRSARLKRECKGGVDAGACAGYTK